ncbi:MAG: HNH endonuclease signature motif containing protein [Ilumatobacteraceae bacterium]
MQRDQLVRLLDCARAVDACTTDRAVIVAAVAATGRLVAWCDAQQMAAAEALEKLGAVPESSIAEASRANQRDGERVVKRARTAKAAPGFGDALAGGAIAAGHLDQLGVSLCRLDSAQQATLLADAPRLLLIAKASTPDQFGRTLRAEERRLQADDGMSRLERQRAAVRLLSRTDINSGMVIFTLTVDPVTGLMLHNKIAAATEALFHDKTPEGCPSDPFEKQAFLRAHAMLSFFEGEGIRLGRPEVVVVIDTSDVARDSTTGAPTVDWGLPVEIPHRVFVELFDRADIHPVIVRNGVVLHASGQVNLGRTTRLANAAQRRALRALYSSCAIPDCAARFDLCKIHHVHWWRHGGLTDLSNLLPLCVRHHTAVHHGGWHLALADDRMLTITQPDETTMTTGPPRRRAA